MIGIQLACVLLSLGKVFLGISQLLLREGQVLLPVPYLYAVSYTHLTLPTTPYV